MTPTGTAQAVAPVKAPPSGRRIEALDWTKGALVVCMVVYHCICYSPFRALAFRVLAFLPPSFVFITGFLVAQVYTVKYDPNSPALYIRLAVRGARLLGLFTLLNLVLYVAAERDLLDGLGEFGERAAAIFGAGNGRGAAFEILVPIAYFLLLAPGYLWLRRYTRNGAVALSLFLCGLCWVLEVRGRPLDNLQLLSAGLLGAACGEFSLDTVNRAARWCYLLPAYVGYRLVGWGVGEPYVVQLFGVLSSLFLLYGLGLRLASWRWTGPLLVLLGHYSLLGYLGQIAVLRAITGVLRVRPATPAVVVGVGLAVLALTVCLVWLADVTRRRSRLVDRIYRVVFA